MNKRRFLQGLMALPFARVFGRWAPSGALSRQAIQRIQGDVDRIYREFLREVSTRPPG